MSGDSVSSSSDEFLTVDDTTSSESSDHSVGRPRKKKAKSSQSDESYPQWVTSNDTPFVNTTSDLFKFVNTINSSSCCMVSKNCKGQLEPVV